MSNPSQNDGSASESAGRAILGRGSIYTVATIAPVVVTLVVTPVLTRALGIAEYGIVAVGISLFRLGGALLAVGLPMAVTRNAIVEQSGIRGASGLVVAGSLIAMVFGGLVAIMAPLWAGQIVREEMILALVPPVISSVGLAMLLLSQALFRSQDNVVDYVAWTFISSLGSPVIGLIAIATIAPTPYVYLWALASGHVLAGAGSVLRVVSIARPIWKPREVATALRMSLPTLPHQLTASFMTAALVVVAAVAIGEEASARVQIALLLGTAPSIVLGALNMGWSPMVYRASGADRPVVLRDSLRMVSGVVLVMSAGFVAALPLVAPFVAGPVMSAPLLQAATIAAIGVVFMTIYLANIHLVFLSGRTTLLGLTTPLAAVIALTVTSIIVPAIDYQIGSVTIGITLFWTGIALASFWLRHRSGEPAVLFTRSLPYLTLSILILTAWAAMAPPLWLGWCVFAVVVFTVYLVDVRKLRARPARGSTA